MHCNLPNSIEQHAIRPALAGVQIKSDACLEQRARLWNNGHKASQLNLLKGENNLTSPCNMTLTKDSEVTSCVSTTIFPQKWSAPSGTSLNSAIRSVLLPLPLRPHMP